MIKQTGTTGNLNEVMPVVKVCKFIYKILKSKEYRNASRIKPMFRKISFLFLLALWATSAGFALKRVGNETAARKAK